MTHARELAACGMTLDEIAASLGWKRPLRHEEEQALRGVMEEGRLLGRAEMKKALKSAAGEGKLQAQRDLLLRLEEDGEGHEGQAFEVRRVILGETETERGPGREKTAARHRGRQASGDPDDENGPEA